MESQKTISEVIGELIEERGISWAELSRSTGISKSTFSRYKSGEMEPTGKSLVQLSAALGVTTDYLLGIEQTERTKKKEATRGAHLQELRRRSHGTLLQRVRRTVDAGGQIQLFRDAEGQEAVHRWRVHRDGDPPRSMGDRTERV